MITQAVLGYTNEQSDSPSFSARGVDRHHSGAVLAAAIDSHPNLTYWVCENEDTDRSEAES